MRSKSPAVAPTDAVPAFNRHLSIARGCPCTFGFCSTILLISLVLGGESAVAQVNNAVLLTTVTNPAPAASANFGSSVAGFGSDRILVGAEVAVAAYLLSLDGSLLTTFTNPTPTGDGFGSVLTGVGSDRVLIGAYSYFVGPNQVGRAYLFSTNGTLLTTFTNPAPASVQAFGFSVAALGNDRVIIGAGDSPMAYLFRTNGGLLATFTNPAPAAGDRFGLSVAAVGSDRVLIGAPSDDTGATDAGAAYLFHTNGTLLATLTNPVPASFDNFGWSVAGVGNDRLLISAIDYGGTKGNGGAAYMFRTNGALLATFTNPPPVGYDYFGSTVSAAGNNRVLIGAYQKSLGAVQDGAAYLFSTNGTLLTVFTNPTPATQDWFGYSVAGFGTDRVIIGTVWDNTGANDSGAAYLFALPYPPLSIARTGGTVSISWVTAETGLILQQTDFLGMPTVWNDTTNSVSVTGSTNAVQQAVVNTTNRFYYLRRP